jgi:hypothetical protein
LGLSSAFRESSVGSGSFFGAWDGSFAGSSTFKRKRRWNLPLRMKPTSPTCKGLSGCLGLGSHKACPYKGYLMASCSRKISQSAIGIARVKEKTQRPWTRTSKDQPHDSKYALPTARPTTTSASACERFQFEPKVSRERSVSQALRWTLLGHHRDRQI